MSSQQAETCGHQTFASHHHSLQAPNTLQQSTHPIPYSLPSPLAVKVSQAAGYPAQQSAMPQGLLLASLQANMGYQAPQPPHYRRPLLQQQHLSSFSSQPPQQQMAGPKVHGGYTAPYPMHGAASQSGHAELFPARLQPPEQPVAYTYAPPPNTAAAAAAARSDQNTSLPATPGAGEWLVRSTAEVVRSQALSTALGTAQAAAPAPAAAAAAAAATVSEMPLERYLDLHAALERGTGSVQSFSAVEAGMFRMADLKQARSSSDLS